MLSVKFNDDATMSLEITQNDRGDWRTTLAQSDASPAYILRGFDGEDFITIHVMGMQSGMWDVVVVFSSVDNYHSVRHSSRRGYGVDTLTELVNHLLHQVTDYPEEAPTIYL